MDQGRPHRGMSHGGILLLVVVVVGGYFLWAYLPALYDDYQLRSAMHEVGGAAYLDRDDTSIRRKLDAKMKAIFAEEVEDGPGSTKTVWKIQVAEDGIHIERTTIPPRLNMWVTYSREIELPLIRQKRLVTFNDHSKADLTPVKW